jgi:hypothetical protein
MNFSKIQNCFAHFKQATLMLFGQKIQRFFVGKPKNTAKNFYWTVLKNIH